MVIGFFVGGGVLNIRARTSDGFGKSLDSVGTVRLFLVSWLIKREFLLLLLVRLFNS